MIFVLLYEGWCINMKQVERQYIVLPQDDMAIHIKPHIRKQQYICSMGKSVFFFMLVKIGRGLPYNFLKDQLCLFEILGGFGHLAFGISKSQISMKARSTKHLFCEISSFWLLPARQEAAKGECNGQFKNSKTKKNNSQERNPFAPLLPSYKYITAQLDPGPRSLSQGPSLLPHPCSPFVSPPYLLAPVRFVHAGEILEPPLPFPGAGSLLQILRHRN